MLRRNGSPSLEVEEIVRALADGRPVGIRHTATTPSTQECAIRVVGYGEPARGDETVFIRTTVEGTEPAPTVRWQHVVREPRHKPVPGATNAEGDTYCQTCGGLLVPWTWTGTEHIEVGAAPKLWVEHEWQCVVIGDGLGSMDTAFLFCALHAHVKRVRVEA